VHNIARLNTNSYIFSILSPADVNPGGPVGYEGDPMASGKDIHRVFSTGMSFDERETVAIIGGGHAFGKTDVHFYPTIQRAAWQMAMC